MTIHGKPDWTDIEPDDMQTSLSMSEIEDVLCFENELVIERADGTQFRVTAEQGGTQREPTLGLKYQMLAPETD